MRALVTHTVAALRRQVHELEYEPRTQWHYHLRMSWFWAFNFLPITALLWLALFDDSHAVLWAAIMLGVNTYYSAYANFVSEMDGAHSAYASMKGVEISNKIDAPAAQPGTAQGGDL